MNPNLWITLAIVTITFIGIAVGQLPFIKSNRTTIALLGVALLLITNQIEFREIPTYLDFNTLILLFSMMIINANLKLAGFFTLAGKALVRFAHTPRTFLALEILLVGLLSALFLNDTVCLMFAPFLLSLMDRLERNPLPYLIALAVASNIGSSATLTGNPQNMIIGNASGIAYLDFTVTLAPIAMLGLGIIWLVLVKFYPYELRRGQVFIPITKAEEEISLPSLVKASLVTVALMAAFLAGAPISLAAFIAANILLFTRRFQPHVVFAEFDWSLLVFFSALFIVSGSLETSGVTHDLIQPERLISKVNVWNLSVFTTILSNLISNVPAVLLLKPFVASLSDTRMGWITIAASSTLAGNLTLLGSVANLIVAETASRWRVDLSFWEYTRPGFIITILTLVIGALWLSLIFPQYGFPSIP